MSKFTEKQLEDIRSSVKGFMDFKVRDMIEDLSDTSSDDQIWDGIFDESIDEDEYFDCVHNGEFNGLPEEEIKKLVEGLTDTYMNLFK